MVGVVLILLVVFLIGPIAVMFGGAIWSALFGWMSSETADAKAAAPAEQS